MPLHSAFPITPRFYPNQFFAADRSVDILSNVATVFGNDLSPPLYCVLGMPVHRIEMDELVESIHRSAKSSSRLFISTPNLNFMILCQRNSTFRQSLLESDVCVADGIGVLLICKLLGVPITSRIAGSDIPAAIQKSRNAGLRGPIRMILFGGQPGVGDRAAENINAKQPENLSCVGVVDPGPLNDSVARDVLNIEKINEIDADFLLVALGAQKGQAWILRNCGSLRVPIISHLGATINFLAGTVRRAPHIVKRFGMEWLWRVKEEPQLARRYLGDGAALASIMVRRAVPLALWLRWNRNKTSPRLKFHFAMDEGGRGRIFLEGHALNDSHNEVRNFFLGVVQNFDDIILDVSRLAFFDMGFAGNILLLEKMIVKKSGSLRIEGAKKDVALALRWSGFGHLYGTRKT
jgi:N-acetylglucosaminyldiphosphoundecaprenol N-acetyl-beta-D-mannosaminyltransferase